jgi:tetratricopeptide (TPR) repeat protein
LAGRGLRRPLRYTLLVAGLLELVFSLVAYPVLSLTARFGDWILIYRTAGSPGLAWATGVVHVAALLALWQWWRRRGKATVFAIGAGAGAEAELSGLQRAVEERPSDPGSWLALADFYARRAELALARNAVEDGIAASGDQPRLLLALARLGMYQGRWNDAVVAARRGLQSNVAPDELADDTGDALRQALWANLALALTQMDRPDHALTAYGHLTEPLADDVRVRYGRGLVRLESGDVEGGQADLRAVIDQLPEGHLLRRWAEARLEGHALTDWTDDRKVPAYAKRTTPPPAPLAGL